MFVSLSALLASGEHTFSVLKQVKNCYRSTMGQDRLNGFTTLSINCDLAQKLDFFSVINAFSEKGLEKCLLNKICYLLNYKIKLVY
jgi:hypothetical protein